MKIKAAILAVILFFAPSPSGGGGGSADAGASMDSDPTGLPPASAS